jgi:hypothetical protein
MGWGAGRRRVVSGGGLAPWWGPVAVRPSGDGCLTEVEVRDDVGFGGSVGGRLVGVVGGEGIKGLGIELERGLRRSSGGGESWRGEGEIQVAEDGTDGLGFS